MKNYATLRHTKVKTEEQHNALNVHNDRTIQSKNVDSSRSFKNMVLTPNPYKNYSDFVVVKRKQIREANKHRKGKERKSRFPRELVNKKTKEKAIPALSQEFIISHSHLALTEQQSIEYLKKAHEFLKEWFKNCEILSSIAHFDERTPHLHFHISYFDQVQNRFVQQELSQNRRVIGKDKDGKDIKERYSLTDIDNIREAFQREVADDFELIKQDGSVVETHSYKASLETAELKEVNEKLNNTNKELEEVNEKLKDTNAELEQGKDALQANLGKAEVALSEKDAQIAILEAKINDLLAKAEKSANNLEELMPNYQSGIIPIDELTSSIERLKQEGGIADNVPPYKVKGLEHIGISSLYDLDGFKQYKPTPTKQTEAERFKVKDKPKEQKPINPKR